MENWMRGAVFVLLNLSFFLFFWLMQEKRPMRRSLGALLKYAKVTEQKRQVREKRLREEEGRQEKENLWWKLDLMLEQCGLKRRFPGLSTEIFLCLVLAVSMLTVLAAGFLGVPVLFRILIGSAVVLGSLIFVILLHGIQYRRIEAGLMTFANLMENYSQTTDDMLSIFRKIAPYLDEPLRSAMEEACAEGMASGQMSQVFLRLEEKIPHEKCRAMLRNLEICSRHEANYQEIIADSRVMLQDYMRSRREEKAMLANARVEMGLILVSSLFVIFLMNGFMEQPIHQILLGSSIGRILLLYCGGVCLAVIWQMMIHTR